MCVCATPLALPPFFFINLAHAGMSFCLPLAYWQDAAKKKAARVNSVQEPLLGGQVRWGNAWPQPAWGGVPML